MKIEIEEIYKNIPVMINSPIEMLEANAPIPIFKGKFVLKDKSREIEIDDGIIQFDWFPSSGATFSGVSHDFIDLIDDLEILIDGACFGRGFLTQVNFESGKSFNIKGVLSQQAITGDKSIPVQKLWFAVPNLREFLGSPVKNTDKGTAICRNRLLLENDSYIITIDKCRNYKELQESLEFKGGYIIQYGGELCSKKKAILFDEIQETFCCLDTFLSFLNGRRTSALFIHGVCDQNIIWRDYSDYFVDPHKNVSSCIIYPKIWTGAKVKKYFVSLAL
jgi:hypothetical protein